MAFRLDYVALPVFIGTLAFNSWAWGGSTFLPEIGPIIQTSAEREAPLVQTYVFLGRQGITLAGAETSARVAAEERFGPARERLLSEPALAMDDLFNESYSSGLAWLIRLHWVPPIALLLFLIGWWRRPRQVQTIRRR